MIKIAASLINLKAKLSSKSTKIFPFIFYIEVNLHLRISNQTGHHHLPPQQRQLTPRQRQLTPQQRQLQPTTIYAF